MKRYLEKFDSRSAQQIVLAKRRETHLSKIALAERALSNAFGKVVEYEFLYDVEENATLAEPIHPYYFHIRGIEGVFRGRSPLYSNCILQVARIWRDGGGLHFGQEVSREAEVYIPSVFWNDVKNVASLKFVTELKVMPNG